MALPLRAKVSFGGEAGIAEALAFSRKLRNLLLLSLGQAN